MASEHKGNIHGNLRVINGNSCQEKHETKAMLINHESRDHSHWANINIYIYRNRRQRCYLLLYNVYIVIYYRGDYPYSAQKLPHVPRREPLR